MQANAYEMYYKTTCMNHLFSSTFQPIYILMAAIMIVMMKITITKGMSMFAFLSMSFNRALLFMLALFIYCLLYQIQYIHVKYSYNSHKRNSLLEDIS